MPLQVASRKKEINKIHAFTYYYFLFSVVMKLHVYVFIM